MVVAVVVVVVVEALGVIVVVIVGVVVVDGVVVVVGHRPSPCPQSGTSPCVGHCLPPAPLGCGRMVIVRAGPFSQRTVHSLSSCLQSASRVVVVVVVTVTVVVVAVVVVVVVAVSVVVTG